MRGNYPQYVQDHPAAKWLLDLYRDYLEPLGIDVAFRTVRQAQLFWDLHAEVAEGSKEERESDAKNLIFLQKILPKFTMDGKTFSDSYWYDGVDLYSTQNGASAMSQNPRCEQKSYECWSRI